jgi:hypothetical protein
LGGPRGTLLGITAVGALVIGLALGWFLRGTPSIDQPAARPSASSPASPSLAHDPERLWEAYFDGVVVRAGDLWALIKIDFGTHGSGQVRVNAVIWAHAPGSAIPIPPPVGTKVCALLGFAPSSLRTGVFDQAKVFVGSGCTTVPIGLRTQGVAILDVRNARRGASTGLTKG